MNLENLDVQELNTEDQKNVDGGYIFIDGEFINSMNEWLMRDQGLL
jgi:small nuclear ribonucleoprotein (snRNP)-like protein